MISLLLCYTEGSKVLQNAVTLHKSLNENIYLHVTPSFLTAIGFALPKTLNKLRLNPIPRLILRGMGGQLIGNFLEANSYKQHN